MLPMGHFIVPLGLTTNRVKLSLVKHETSKNKIRPKQKGKLLSTRLISMDLIHSWDVSVLDPRDGVTNQHNNARTNLIESSISYRKRPFWA